MIALSAALGDLFPPPSFVELSVVSTTLIAFCNKILYHRFEPVSPAAPFKRESVSWKASCEVRRSRSRTAFWSEGGAAESRGIMKALCSLTLECFWDPALLLVVEESSYKSNHEDKWEGHK